MDRDELKERFSSEGEVVTTFEDVARSIANDERLLDTGSEEMVADYILEHFESLTIADIVREAIFASDVREVRSILEILKENASNKEGRHSKDEDS